MAWIQLLIAGILEACWAISLKLSDGMTRPVPSVVTVVTMAGSVYLLALAARTLPIGTAYSIWVGFGAGGAIIIGMIWMGESTSPVRLFFLILLLVSIVGLKVTS
ncbi:multidrug efflux SMR transporter [bacterium]|nr:multidrug efflux SMR transporter [bacterium]